MIEEVRGTAKVGLTKIKALKFVLYYFLNAFAPSGHPVFDLLLDEVICAISTVQHD